MSEAKQFTNNQVDSIIATIPSGSTTSNIVKLYGCTAIGFTTPSALTTTSITFLGRMGKDGSFVPVFDNSNPSVLLSKTVTTSTGYPLNAEIFAPYDAIKVVAADGNEGAARDIIIKPFLI